MTGRVYCLTDLDCQALIDEFDNRVDAEAALARFVRQRPEEASHIGILRFDSGGRQIGAPITADVLLTA
jgi:hypothetical protein